MLTRARAAVARCIDKVAYLLSRAGLTPNKVTALGLAISFLCLAGACLANPYAVFLAVVLSSAMDLLDGAVARVSGRVTKFGSVLDSFFDRVEEFIYMTSLALLGVHHLIVISALALSFFISYLRSLGEKHGLRVEGVGILERGERVLLIAVAVLAIAFGSMVIANVVLVLMIALGTVTVVQRLLYIRSELEFGKAGRTS